MRVVAFGTEYSRLQLQALGKDVEATRPVPKLGVVEHDGAPGEQTYRSGTAPSARVRYFIQRHPVHTVVNELTTLASVVSVPVAVSWRRALYRTSVNHPAVWQQQ